MNFGQVQCSCFFKGWRSESQWIFWSAWSSYVWPKWISSGSFIWRILLKFLNLCAASLDYENSPDFHGNRNIKRLTWRKLGEDCQIDWGNFSHLIPAWLLLPHLASSSLPHNKVKLGLVWWQQTDTVYTCLVWNPWKKKKTNINTASSSCMHRLKEYKL